MRVFDSKTGAHIDVDPVDAAKAMLRYARQFNDGKPEHGLTRDAWEQKALSLIRAAAAACPRCGAYEDQPHPEWCDKPEPEE